MVGGRTFGFAFLVLVAASLGAHPGAACHGSGDLCLPCADDAGGSCDVERELDDVRVLAQVREYAFPDDGPEDVVLSTHMVGLRGDERRGYLAVQFEWATDDHMAPAGHASVPFQLEFDPEDGVTWDGATSSSFTFSSNETGQQTLHFAFTGPSGDITIGYRIVANPGPGQEEASGEMTLASYEPDVDWTYALVRFWPIWLLFLLVGLAGGLLLARLRTP